MALDAGKTLLYVQKLVSDGKAVVDLPRTLDEIEKHDLWRQWATATGKPFKSFVEAVSAKQPYGLGIGQYHGWLTAIQTYELCSGYNRVRELLRPLIAHEVRPVSEHGGSREQVDNVKLTSGGNSTEYLLGRMKREAANDPKVAAAFQGWQDGKHSSVRSAAIAAGIIKVADSDRDRCPVARIKMYWKRASKRQREELIAWLSSAEAALASPSRKRK